MFISASIYSYVLMFLSACSCVLRLKQYCMLIAISACTYTCMLLRTRENIEKKIISHSWNIFHFQRQTLEYPLCMLCKCICISIDISHYNQRLLTSFFRYIGFHELKISFQNTGILSIQFSRGGGGGRRSSPQNPQIPTLCTCLKPNQISLMFLRIFVNTVYRFPWLTILYNIGLNPASGKGWFFRISYKRFSCLFLITICS